MDAESTKLAFTTFAGLLVLGTAGGSWWLMRTMAASWDADDKLRKAVQDGTLPVLRMWAEGPFDEDEVRLFVKTNEHLRKQVRGFSNGEYRAVIDAVRAKGVPVEINEVQADMLIGAGA